MGAVFFAVVETGRPGVCGTTLRCTGRIARDPHWPPRGLACRPLDAPPDCIAAVQVTPAWERSRATVGQHWSNLARHHDIPTDRFHFLSSDLRDWTTRHMRTIR